MNPSQFITEAYHATADKRPLVESISIQRSLMQKLESASEFGNSDLDEVINWMDYVQLTNDLDWFSDGIAESVQEEKIIADTLCRSDILVSLRVDNLLSKSNLEDQFGLDDASNIIENPIHWITSPEHEPPQEIREKQDPKELQYPDTSEAVLKTAYCWEGTKLYDLRELLTDLTSELPFTEEAILFYLDTGVRPIMTRWKLNGDDDHHQDHSTEVTLNTRMMKTNDFQMLKAKLEKRYGELPSYIDPKDHILFQVVWHEFDGSPEVMKMKTWEEILDRVHEYGVEKWSSSQSVRTRWSRLLEKIQADEYGKMWVEEIL